MKKTYKAAMDQITVSDALRERVLAAAAKQASMPQMGNTWLKPALGAAACLIVTLAAGTWLNLGSIGKSGGSSAPQNAASYSMTAECALDTDEEAGEADKNGYDMPGGAADGTAGTPQVSAPAAVSSQNSNADSTGSAESSAEKAAGQTERKLYEGQTVAYNTLAEAQAALSFTAEIPAFVAEKTANYSVTDGAVLQISWTEESRNYTCFVTETVTEPANSPNYADYTLNETTHLNQEETAEFYGSGGEEINLIVMEKNSQIISLLSDEGMNTEEAAVIAQSFLLSADSSSQETEAVK